MSYIVCCPTRCMMRICAYCARKSNSSTRKKMPDMARMPVQAAFSAILWFIAGTKYRSMALRKRIGGASSRGVTTATRPSASTTHHLYGAMYCKRRRISRESYAFPNASSSCKLLMKSFRRMPLRAFQLFFQQLFVIKIGVIPACRQQGIVRAAFGDAPVEQHHDLIGVAYRRG